MEEPSGQRVKLGESGPSGDIERTARRRSASAFTAQVSLIWTILPVVVERCELRSQHSPNFW
jgi:hypothetical protein